MPFNMVGFAEALPGTGTNPVAVGLGEDLYTVVGDDILVTKQARYVLGMMAWSVGTGGRMILRQPKMIDYDNHKVSLIADVAPKCGSTELFARPLPLRVDRLGAFCVNAVSEDTILGVLLGSGKITQAMKDSVNPTHLITGFSDQLIVANTWTPCAVTWNETLDAGIYEIVGMRGVCYGAAALNAALMRLRIPGSMSWRPGVPCGYGGAAHLEWQGMYDFPFKDWSPMGIRFDTQHMPNIEVLSCGAHTDEDVELTLQKVG